MQNKDAKAALDVDAPIGVFDSGIGGLSILKALLTELPEERFVFIADAAFAPYGDRCEDTIRDRSALILAWLRSHHHIKALVIACNTATAAAADVLRQTHPDLPIVGVEPALKPAATRTRTGRVAVLATPATLQSPRFAKLLARQNPAVEFILQACPGLAAAIEHNDAQEIEAQCKRHIDALALTDDTRPIDTVVLGCTHYPFATPTLQRLLGANVQLIDTGHPVARQTRAVLAQQGLRRNIDHHGSANPSVSARVSFYATAHPQRLQDAISRWLAFDAPIQVAVIEALASNSVAASVAPAQPPQ